jgi:cytochrome c oxidase subunit I+III
LPIVNSRYPLWEQNNLDQGPEREKEVIRLLERWPTKWQASVVSDVLTGQIKEVFWLPNATYIPVVTALGLAIALGALIFDVYWLGAIGFAITLIAYLIWMWPDHRSDSDHNPEVEARFKELGVMVYTHSSPTIARWSLFLTLSIAMVTLGVFLFCYFFLAVNSEAWPPKGIGMFLPATDLAFIGLAIVALSNAFVIWGSWSNGLVRSRSTPGLMLGFITALVAGGLQMYAYTHLDFSWSEHAYGSIFYLLAAFQLFMLFVSLVMTSIAITRLSTNDHEDEVEWVKVTAKNAALTHYLMTGIWLAIFFTLYLSSRLL